MTLKRRKKKERRHTEKDRGTLLFNMPDLPFAVDELGCLGRRVLGDPRARVPRLDAETVKLVDLLKTKTPSLGNHEVDVEDSEDQNTSEDQENQRADILSDCKVVKRQLRGPNQRAS